jgi:hypothetical protein
VASRLGPVEIRQYGPRIAAETVVDADEVAARSAGFRRLAGYIFGGNRSRSRIGMTAPVAQSASQKIEMTAPVAQARDASGRWAVRFFMPPGSTMQTLPVQNDPTVQHVNLPAAAMAVLRLTGDRGPAAMQAHQQALLQRMAGSESSSLPSIGTRSIGKWFTSQNSQTDK